ncbi:hypothetical protein XELAEV_18042954mg [Xenopus laevis]|uniref:S100/CaBP-9k-type calcium binding subdomain domain-containing protein n=1 Tax=Xenopus laevis TaxID=8355 RepID=A0A974C5A3_XENLA|nr:hypothetical protein XELAEV_18042954mg [Xenopus laevis]
MAKLLTAFQRTINTFSSYCEQSSYCTSLSPDKFKSLIQKEVVDIIQVLVLRAEPLAPYQPCPSFQGAIDIFTSFSSQSSSHDKLSPEEFKDLIQKEFVNATKDSNNPKTFETLVQYKNKKNQKPVEFKEFLDFFKNVATAYYDDLKSSKENKKDQKHDQPTPHGPTQKHDQRTPHGPTEKQDQPTPHDPTQKQDKAITHGPTQKQDQPTTHSPTQKHDQPATHSPTQKHDQPATHDPTQKEDKPATRGPIQKQDKPATHGPTLKQDQPATHGPTEKQDKPTIHGPTQKQDKPATHGPTEKQDKPTTHGPTQKQD